jgi:hypothetical protein
MLVRILNEAPLAEQVRVLYPSQPGAEFARAGEVRACQRLC